MSEMDPQSADELSPGTSEHEDVQGEESSASEGSVHMAADNDSLADDTGTVDAAEDGLAHTEEQLGDESGVEEALQAWEEGGHVLEEFEDDEQIASVRFPQLEIAVPKVHKRPELLNNVEVTITVELGRKLMTVSELTNLREQDVIELDKLAGEAFEIRINGRLFAAGEVVVVTDLMAVRLTSLLANQDTQKMEKNE